MILGSPCLYEIQNALCGTAHLVRRVPTCACTCIGFHPGRVEPASSRASTSNHRSPRRQSWAKSHEMANQSRFHRRRPTTWGPDSAARSSLILLVYVFSSPPTRFCQLEREAGRSTSRMSSPSRRRAAYPNHRRRRWNRTGERGRRFRQRFRVVVSTRSIRWHRRM